MVARLRKFLSDLGETFWLLPGVMVAGGILAAIGSLDLDRSGVLPHWLVTSTWLYNGGATGARTLLGAVASSTIGVAGTVFAITIAALSLAAGQMGPRLLRNFTRDRGNQFTLGTFLGTFSFALMVLRSVRTQSEGRFVPHLSMTLSIVLAFMSVGTLVYFVGHMAGRINVDTVIELVSREVKSGILRLTSDTPQPPVPAATLWQGGELVRDPREGYVQQLEGDGLANWAEQNATAIRLLVRPGDYVFPGAAIAMMVPPVAGAAAAIRDATALGPQRVSSADLEFAVRQLVEVAVRALSPGINDPHTAMSVLDRLGGALCDLNGRHLASGVFLRQDRPVLVVAGISYDGLCDGMFNLIRQNAAGSVAVLIRLLEVLSVVAGCDTVPERLDALQRQAGLVLDDATRSVDNPLDLEDVKQRHRAFLTMRRFGPAGPPASGPGSV